MTYSISLKIQPTTYQRFETIHQKLNAGETESQSKALGDNLADIACEILDQVFGQMARMNKSGDNESEKIIQQIRETTRKYMPWSVSFFGNDRLVPMVNYLYGRFYSEDGQHYMHYPIDASLATDLLAYVNQMKEGQNQYVPLALKAFTQVVDAGVTHLVREPKKMLKFNMVVDKTLTGVINLTTQLGYKRFDKLGKIYDAQSMSQYFDHFMVFLNNEPVLRKA
ncbi:MULTISPECIES: hypothetical protein [unclassified Acinetobacter]|uniref:hypothetical protein n=1 Tax=unclassified Acinetobacter TaxID=196816 RepID=UPI000991BDE9|nr:MULTISPECIES: hypothetical protein [unclassified Acinetobacter]OOV84143.1 hypothetical protein B1201_02625 [Acinetobacter sp. ANC 5600]QOW49026.1 hypothetical protein G0029_03970 [Acinetobacter sp. YH12138]